MTMTTWDYRIVKFTEDDGNWSEEILCILEVYYNKEGKPHSYCKADVVGSNLEELVADLNNHIKATKKPILHYPEDFK